MAMRYTCVGKLTVGALALLALAACGQGANSDQTTATRDKTNPSEAPSSPKRGTNQACTGSEASLDLPQDFCASIFATDLGSVRHIAATPDGRLYAILRSKREGRGLVALRDSDGDGRADEVQRFGDFSGTGLRIHNNWLYAASSTTVYRWPLPDQQLAPVGEPQVMVSGFPEQGQHAAKSLAIGGGRLYVNVGAPSNACMENSRTQGSPGMDPCPLLDGHGGIWAFDADTPGQEYSEQARFASGIRNAVALAWHPGAAELYAVQHGRDQLHQFFPELYSTEENARLPAEEMFRVETGDDFGWPYCYYDQRRGQKVLAPEYGGDGARIGRCADFEDPIVAFPGHWAPNGLLFYTADAFPAQYQGGAFVAFHGSWNRAPEPQAGYRVSFVPFDGATPAGEPETFADGFSGHETLDSPGDARYRPMGLAQGPDGALYISDTREGRIWRVVYTGD